MRMPPRPKPRMLGALDKLAVDFLHVDKIDVPLVGFARFVDKRKHAARARKTHNDRVDLLRNLIDVVGKLPRHLQKGNDERHAEHGKFFVEQHADRHVGNAVEDKHAAQNGDDNVNDVPDIAQNGHEHIGVTVRLIGLPEQEIVHFIEIAFCFFFVAEHFYDALPVHVFLDKALGLRHGFLLREEVTRRAAADHLRHDENDRHARQHDSRQPKTVPKHDAEQRKNHDCRS